MFSALCNFHFNTCTFGLWVTLIYLRGNEIVFHFLVEANIICFEDLMNHLLVSQTQYNCVLEHTILYSIQTYVMMYIHTSPVCDWDMPLWFMILQLEQPSELLSCKLPYWFRWLFFSVRRYSIYHTVGVVYTVHVSCESPRVSKGSAVLRKPPVKAEAALPNSYKKLEQFKFEKRTRHSTYHISDGVSSAALLF